MIQIYVYQLFRGARVTPCVNRCSSGACGDRYAGAGVHRDDPGHLPAGHERSADGDTLCRMFVFERWGVDECKCEVNR